MPGFAAREQESDRRQDNDEDKGRNKGGGGGDDGKPPLDPLLRGLVDRLPPSDTEWSVTDRVKWLQTASNVFDLIYKGDGGIEIRAAMANRSPRPE